MKVLVGNKSGAIIIEGHVQGLSNTRALGEAGIPIVVVDMYNCVARYSKYCNSFYHCPNYIETSFIDFLIELASSQNLHGWVLVPSNDHAVVSISKHRHVLENYYKIITPHISIIEKIYDKSKLLEVAQACNVPIPKTYYLEDTYTPKRDLSYPVLTKGRQGLSFYKATGKKVFLSNSDRELNDNLKRIEKVVPISETLTQECIPYVRTNKTISFTAFCIDGEIQTHWTGIKIREHPTKFGTATFTQSTYIDSCYRHSCKLLKSLNYTGVCEVEYILDPRIKEYKLIEVNPRTWLWVGLAKTCGINYPLMIYNYTNGLRNIFPSNYMRNYKWVNLATDLPFSLLALFKRQLSIKEFINSFQSKIVLAVFSWKDILPGIIFPFMLILYSGKRKKTTTN